MDSRAQSSGIPGNGGRPAAPKAREPIAAPPATGEAVPAEAVCAQLDRLLSSTLFRYSERLTRFLRFVIEQSLKGETGQLKESVLAIEIFDREASYDSRIDSIVRVEARRLRDKLEKYYQTEGQDDPVVITLPKGSYVPVIALRAGAQGGAEAAVLPQTRPPLKLALGFSFLALILCAVALAYWSGSKGAAPPAAVQRLTSDSGLTFEPALSRDGKLLAFSSDRGGTGGLDIWVQQVPRGAPVRLTEGPADSVEPSFSTDGTLIAYRAEGELDGIYMMPALGGKSTLLARGGYRPRFSRDGTRIAFWNGERTFRTARVFVVPAAGGSPVQIQPELSYAAYPIWTPDGQHLLLVAAKGMVSGDPNVDDWDWWVAPAGGGPAIRTSARGVLEAAGLRPPSTGWAHRRIVPYCFTPSGHVVFSARSGDQTNIWQVRINRRDWQVVGPPEQLTFGAGRQDHPSMAGDGSLVFSALTLKSDVWSLPIAPETAETLGPLARVTSGPSDSNRPVVSRDGRRIVFISNRTGNEEVWVRDLKAGREVALTATGTEKSSVVLSPDGSRIAFGYASPSNHVFSMPFAGGKAVELCSDCGEARAWLPGGAGLLYQRPSSSGDSQIGVLDPSGRRTPLVGLPGSALFSPSVATDGKWMAVVVRTPPNDHRVMVVPLRGAAAAPRTDWIPITEPGAWVDKPRWSPRGAMLYYVSDRDGFVCIWARRLDPATKKPVGEPKVVMHFHSGRTSAGTVYAPELSVAEDKLVFNLREGSGNIWLAAGR